MASDSSRNSRASRPNGWWTPTASSTSSAPSSSIPSSSFEEQAIADYLAEYMTGIGLEVEMMDVTSPRDPSVVSRQPIGRLPGTGRRPEPDAERPHGPRGGDERLERRPLRREVRGRLDLGHGGARRQGRHRGDGGRGRRGDPLGRRGSRATSSSARWSPTSTAARAPGRSSRTASPPISASTSSTPPTPSRTCASASSWPACAPLRPTSSSASATRRGPRSGTRWNSRARSSAASARASPRPARTRG